MRCFERAHLFAYAHRMLEAREAAEVRAHLETCVACRAMVAEYERLESVLDEWKPAEPSPWFDARVRQAVKAQGAARASAGWMRPLWSRLAAASLVVLVLAVSLVTYRSYKVSGPPAPAQKAAELRNPPRRAPEASGPTQPAPYQPSKAARSSHGEGLGTGPAPQPSSESNPPVVAAKKAGASVEPAKTKRQPETLLAERMEIPAPKAADLESPPRRVLQAEALNQAARPTGALEARRDFVSRGGEERGASAQPTAAPLAIQALAPTPTGAAGSLQRTAQPAPVRIGGVESKAMVAQSQAQVKTRAVQEGVEGESSATTLRRAEAQSLPPSQSPEGPAVGGTAGRQPLAGQAVPPAVDRLAQAPPGLLAPVPPGLLESFLKRHPDAVLTKRLLGTLEGRGATKATFTAVVASDPADPATKVKGLVVQLEDGDRKATVYVDDDRDEAMHEDSLWEFQRRLERLPDKDKALEYWRRAGSANSEWTFGGIAHNRPADSPRYCCPRNGVLGVGWYKHGEEVGVVIDALDPFRLFYFPGLEMAKVVEMVAAGRAFLNAN